MDDRSRIFALEQQVAALQRKLARVMAHVGLPDVEPGPPAEVTEALKWLAKGDKIQAIQAYRAVTGASLSTAKQVVDELEAGVRPR
ncbi:MAG: hypothetical protein Q8Q09_05815 [Deltaproteobacteria bacterium]|nr:hypothetical protein [Deltaproteobacteria bacterium]